VFSKTENDYWATRDAEDAKNHHILGYADRVLPVTNAGQTMIFDDYVEIADVLSLEPAPGHTPEHAVIGLKSDCGYAVMTGDFFIIRCRWII
jgi:glyoxylase-like metal-dependent hydrolase (beta-lactamase superfamily II)